VVTWNLTLQFRDGTEERESGAYTGSDILLEDEDSAKRIAKLRPTNESWRVDETFIRVKGKWADLYRVVDSTGATIDFLLWLNAT
jgi:hypothetical protein